MKLLKYNEQKLLNKNNITNSSSEYYPQQFRVMTQYNIQANGV